MLTVEEFRRKYPGSSEEQVALYGQAVAAEEARGPVAPEPDLPMPRITVPAIALTTARLSTAPSTGLTYRLTAEVTRGGQRFVTPHLDQVPPREAAPDLTTDIRRIVLSRRLSARERAQAERADMTGDDLLALLAGVPNAREFEALEGGD